MSNPLVSRCSIPDDQNVELQSLTPAVAKMSVDQSPALDKEVESPEESQPVFIQPVFIPDDQNVELQSLTPAVAKMSVDQSPALDKEVESPEESQPVFILTSIVILLFNQLLSLC
uniref:Uncharacterized protein n=1 Tax=Ditylenchus dipsaci TaxID=166011 RepID=A0A915CXZ9_9BILA